MYSRCNTKTGASIDAVYFDPNQPQDEIRVDSKRFYHPWSTDPEESYTCHMAYYDLMSMSDKSPLLVSYNSSGVYFHDIPARRSCFLPTSKRLGILQLVRANDSCLYLKNGNGYVFKVKAVVHEDARLVAKESPSSRYPYYHQKTMYVSEEEKVRPKSFVCDVLIPRITTICARRKF